MSEFQQVDLIVVDLVIEARWLLPVVPSGLLLEYSAVVIHQSKILEICSISEINLKYQPNHTVKCDEHVLMPGLINLHVHAAMTLMRGLADDLSLMPWLNNHIWPAEKKVVSEKFVHDGTLLGCAEMLQGGITTFNDMYFYPLAAAEAVTRAGMRAQLGLVVLEFPTNYANDAEDYIKRGSDAKDSWGDNPLITASFAPHAPYSVSDQTFTTLITLAEELGLGIHTHLHETLDEIAQSEAQYGMRPLKRLAELGLLGPNFVAAHGVYLQVDEMALLAQHGCHIAHCPASNLKLGSGIAQLSKLLAQQVNVGIGTDGAASNNRLDMFAEMRLSALLAKGVSADAASVPAMAALEMATINGAKALGLDQEIGSIEVGKLADLIAVKMSNIASQPCFDPLSQLVYATASNQVTHTWIAGQLQYQKHEHKAGVFSGIPLHQLTEMMAYWQPKLMQFKA
ncbi:MAG: TRZ/ATZ family hydrolase [Methylophilaceae bacterium]|nr:TRZ/ATZ family hydrolase [Methylophilaceae bacterium]